MNKIIKHSLPISLICITIPIITAAQDVILTADGNSGHDDCWEKRAEAGVQSWGIRGTGYSMNGNIWWNSFPGETGTYNIKLGAVLENDGDSPYKFYINNQMVTEGRYPFYGGSLNCESSKKGVADIDLGTHTVPQGAKITYWAQSVYPCGSSHGQYSRFYQIKFTPQSGGQPTVAITAPLFDSLIAGEEYTFLADGETIAWTYDVSGDGQGAFVLGSGNSVTFTIPLELAGKTVTVTAAGSGGSDSKIYSIRSQEAAITLTWPMGGETITIGEQITIEWNADTMVITDVDIEMSVDGGVSWEKINTTGSISLSDKDQWGNFPWIVTEQVGDITLADSCMFRVRKYEATEARHISVSGWVYIGSGSATSRRQASGMHSVARVSFSRGGTSVLVHIPQANAPFTASLVDAAGTVHAAVAGVHGCCRLPAPKGAGIYFVCIRYGNEQALVRLNVR